jgi:hypothetical protein
MRAPLDKIELVEKYLTGKLTAAEQLNFIKAMETDVELQQLVNLQKDIIKTVQRKALKAEIKATIQKVNLWKKLWKWIIGGGIVVSLIIAGLLALNQTPQITKRKSGTVLSVSTQAKEEIAIPDSTAQADERIDFNGLKTWVDPDVQTFKVNPTKGATIEGKEGTLIIVPSNAFVDEQNKVVTTEVEFKLVEALKLEDMILYNLGTTSNGKALGTGGMLNFDFTASGKKVKVDPKRPLYVEVPTNKVKEGMMAFKGEAKNGKINWVDPKPLKKYLVNVDFKLLDFLPTGFEDTVRTLLPLKGHKAMSSALTDSLYYGLDYLCREGYGSGYSKISFNGITTISKDDGKIIFRGTNDSLSKMNESNLVLDGSDASSCCGIDPLAIKTLKTLPFAKTFIATQEFAERVRELHKLENGNEWLKIYVSNLSKNLSYADSLVTIKLTGDSKHIFTTFAKQRLTNIKDAAIYQDQLNAYYTKKKQEYRKEQENQRYTFANKSKEELTQLLTTLPSQKIATKITPLNVATGTSYAFSWASPGWVNLDCYLHLLDAGSEEVRMNLRTIEGITEVYQWINFVGNLTPLVINGTEAKAMFPARDKPAANVMRKTFCCAINRKDGAYKWFDLRYDPYETKTITIDLKSATLAEIKTKLKSYGAGNELGDRLTLIEKEITQALKDKVEMEKRANEFKKEQAIRAKLQAAAFPCELKLTPSHKKKTF